MIAASGAPDAAALPVARGRRAPLAAFALLAAACTTTGTSSSPTTLMPSPARTPPSTVVASPATIPDVTTPPATLPTIVTTPPGVIPARVCLDPAAEVSEFAPAGTTVLGPDEDNFEGVVQPTPDVVCPGDHVEFTVTIVNRSDVALTYAISRGLRLQQGMWRWTLGRLPVVSLGPGEVWSGTVTATIPPVQPGTYSLWAGGHVSGKITVLDPATAHTS